MSDRAHILLVDDDPTMIEIERFQLGEENYRYTTAEDGLDALVKIASDRPDIILLDVNMPKLDGLETCKHIRKDSDNDNISIIFVTSKNDAQTRKAAYEVGGDDVLVKPLDPSEILSKVENAAKSQQRVTALHQEMAETMGVLMTTIITSGEYGVVMNFFRNSYACKSMAELAEVVLKALDDFGLTGCVQLRSGEQILTVNSERRSSPLEQEMLYDLSMGNRHIYDYGNRTAFCYANVAVLIKAMPLDEPEAYGRIKDNVALLAEGAEFRLTALVEETRVREQKEALTLSVAAASKKLAQVNTDYKRGQSDMSNIFSRLEQRLEWALAGLGLSDEQERGMWEIVTPLGAEANSLYDEGLSLDSQLTEALTALRQSLSLSDPATPPASDKQGT